MAKFVVADQAFKYLGGHIYEYDYHVLANAERAGWEPVLVTHEELRGDTPIPSSWQVHPAFQCGLETHFMEKWLGLRRRVRCRLKSWADLKALASWQALRRLRYERRSRDMFRRYGAGFNALFAGTRLQAGDQIFIPTMLPLDVASLTAWARRVPEARNVDWHMQFHFPLVEAAEWFELGPHGSRRETQPVAKIFEALYRVIPRERVHLYATTTTLADHFAHCIGEQLHALDYPVNHEFSRSRARDRKPGPLRVVSPGELRVEKGQQLWPKLIENLKQDYLIPGRLQLIAQAAWGGVIPDELKPWAASWPLEEESPARPDTVAFAPFPLTSEAYLDLVTSTDIGLMIYDPLRYFFRCSGVMVEMLAAGIPMLAPAGCWLSDQISEPIFAHQDHWPEWVPTVAIRRRNELKWNVAAAGPTGGILAGAQTGSNAPPAEAKLATPPHADHLLISFRRDKPNLWNRHVAVVVDEFDENQKPLRSNRHVVGTRENNRPIRVLHKLDGRSQRLSIRWENAYGGESFELHDVECRLLAAGSSAPPRGAVGLLLNDKSQLADCLRDVVDHHDHYNHTVRAMAEKWAPLHTAAKVVEDLLERGKTCPPAVVRKAA